MQKKLELLIKILIGVTFFVPLVALPNNYVFPFIVPKILLFRSLAIIMLGLYVLLLASNWQKYKVRLTPINVIVGLFFASFTISAFVGVDWYKSFWDNHERMLGVFTIFHYVMYYYVITTLVKEWKEWRWFFRLFLFAGGIIMLIGAWQMHIDTEFLFNKGAQRVSASLGNAIYFSGYGLFLLAISVLLAIKDRLNGEKFWFWYSVVGGLLGLWGIFLGGTRGVLLGLIAGIGMLLVCYLFTLKDYKKARLTIGMVMLLGIILVTSLYIFRKTEFVSEMPAVGRLVNTQLSKDNTRIMAWGVAIDMWKDYPVFGWGPNNFYFGFNQHYRPEFLSHGWKETWFDNAHNIVMNTLAVQGATGLLVYFSLFGITISSLWRGYRRDFVGKHIMGVSIAFLTAHLVQSVFVFENPTSYLFFFFFLAFVNSQTFVTPIAGSDPEKKKHRNNVSIGLAVVIGLVVLLLVNSTNVAPGRANKKTLESIKFAYSNNFSKSLSLYNEAMTFDSPHSDDIRLDMARVLEQKIFQSVQQKKSMSEDFNDLFRKVYDDLQINYDLHPLDIRTHILDSQLLQYKEVAFGEAGSLERSKIVLETALAHSPKRQHLEYLLSTVYARLGQFDSAVKILEESVNNNLKINDGWWRMIVILVSTGNMEAAEQVAEKAVESGVKFNGVVNNTVDEILAKAALPGNTL